MARISVIIPTLNEAAHLRSTLLRLESQDVHEIIVADGGSRDETIAIAEAMHAKVVQTKPARPVQLNAGADIATGDVLLFLHGDTLLPAEGIVAVRNAITNTACVGGAFRLRTDLRRFSMWLVEAAINVRSRAFKWPYGDQGLFVRREVFEQLEGFRNLPIMEDLDFVSRLRRMGRLQILKQHVTTSGRRWAANGVWRTTLVNWTATAMHLFGRPHENIRGFYDRWSSSRARTTIQAANDNSVPSLNNPAINPKPTD